MSNLSELLPSGGAQNVVEFVASGTLPNGKPVILNSNGTVTVVSGESTTESIPSSGEYVFTASGDFTQVAFDPNNASKFVVCYAKYNGAPSGRASVGTISGSTISFGSEYGFHSGTYVQYTSISFDPNNSGKFVISYQAYGGGNNGKAVVGTVSGTAISSGSEYTFNSANTTTTSVSFDPNTSGKFVVSFTDAGNSNYGTAIVGTVSGTAISFGSEAVFNSANTANSSLSFDPNTSGKVVVSFTNAGNSNYGTAIVGTISGTTITFGSAYVYESASVLYPMVAYDTSHAGKLVVVYRDDGNVGRGTAIVGTVSGTAISFGSALVFNNSGASNYIGVSFATDASATFVTTYQDTANGGKGTAILGRIATNTTNLTATNLIGISAEAIASGATGEINVLGGLNEGQSSLTPLSIYYVQENGTITTASASPAQKIGQAISSTKLNLVDL